MDQGNRGWPWGEQRRRGRRRRSRTCTHDGVLKSVPRVNGDRYERLTRGDQSTKICYRQTTTVGLNVEIGTKEDKLIYDLPLLSVRGTYRPSHLKTRVPRCSRPRSLRQTDRITPRRPYWNSSFLYARPQTQSSDTTGVGSGWWDEMSSCLPLLSPHLVLTCSSYDSRTGSVPRIDILYSQCPDYGCMNYLLGPHFCSSGFHLLSHAEYWNDESDTRDLVVVGVVDWTLDQSFRLRVRVGSGLVINVKPFSESIKQTCNFKLFATEFTRVTSW